MSWDQDRISPLSTALLAALFAGVATFALGSLFGGLFGLLLFGTALPFLQILGAFGLGLTQFYFPFFVPVAGCLALPASWFLMRRRGTALTIPRVFQCWATALLILSVISGLATSLVSLKSERRELAYQQRQQAIESLRSSTFRVSGLDVEVKASRVDIQARLTGSLPGTYELRAFIGDPKPLVEKTRRLILPAEKASVGFTVGLTEIQQTYRQSRLEGPDRTVIVGEASYQVRIELELLRSDKVENLEGLLPALSPDRTSGLTRTVLIELGRF